MPFSFDDDDNEWKKMEPTTHGRHQTVKELFSFRPDDNDAMAGCVVSQISWCSVMRRMHAKRKYRHGWTWSVDERSGGVVVPQGFLWVDFGTQLLLPLTSI